jgi:hypothetical protein
MTNEGCRQQDKGGLVEDTWSMGLGWSGLRDGEIDALRGAGSLDVIVTGP